MKLISQTWQCSECEEIVTTEGGSGAAEVMVCIDFARAGNPWIGLCPKCVARLEQVWPKLVAYFRELAKKETHHP